MSVFLKENGSSDNVPGGKVIMDSVPGGQWYRWFLPEEKKCKWYCTLRSKLKLILCLLGYGYKW